MDEERLSQTNLSWIPTGRKRPKTRWRLGGQTSLEMDVERRCHTSQNDRKHTQWQQTYCGVKRNTAASWMNFTLVCQYVLHGPRPFCCDKHVSVRGDMTGRKCTSCDTEFVDYTKYTVFKNISYFLNEFDKVISLETLKKCSFDNMNSVGVTWTLYRSQRRLHRSCTEDTSHTALHRPCKCACTSVVTNRGDMGKT
jgi:hypothetical protein